MSLVATSRLIAAINRRLWVTAIFVCALILRLAFVFTNPTISLDVSEMSRVTESVAAGRGISDPYACPTGPTAILAPGYPLLAGTIWKLSSNLTFRGVVLGLLASTATSLSWALLPILAERIGMPFHIGTLAGFLGAFFPMLPGLESRGAWEGPLATLFLVVGAILLAKFTTTASWHDAVLSGLVWGLAFWFAPNLLPVFGLLICFCLSISALKVKAVSVVLISLIVIAPWIVRNYSRFGRLFWVRDGLGLELRLSNNRAAAPIFTENFWHTPSYDIHPSRGGRGNCEHLRAVGELAFMDEQQRMAVSWMGAEPIRFIHLTMLRIWYFWVPPLPFCRCMLAGGFGALSLMGLFVAWFTSPKMSCFLASAILAYPLLYYVIQIDARYRQPIQPVIMLSATWMGFSIFRNYSQP